MKGVDPQRVQMLPALHYDQPGFLELLHGGSTTRR